MLVLKFLSHFKIDVLFNYKQIKTTFTNAQKE